MSDSAKNIQTKPKMRSILQSILENCSVINNSFIFSFLEFNVDIVLPQFIHLLFVGTKIRHGVIPLPPSVLTLFHTLQMEPSNRREREQSR